MTFKEWCELRRFNPNKKRYYVDVCERSRMLTITLNYKNGWQSQRRISQRELVYVMPDWRHFIAREIVELRRMKPR